MSEDVKKEAQPAPKQESKKAKPEVAPAEAKPVAPVTRKGRVEKIDHPSGAFTIEHL